MLDKIDETKIEKMMVKVVGNALEQIVLPELQEIRDDISGVKDDVSGLKKDMKIVKEDIGTIKEDISDLQATSNRIETLAKSEIKYVDDLSGRVLKLETTKA